MSASAENGGASALIWTGIGAVVGIAAGWWYDAWAAYTLFGVIAGWLVGLSLGDAGGDH